MVKKETKKRGKGMMIVGIIIILAVVAILVFAMKSGPSYSKEDIDSFAKCITEKGAVMYGAFWCPHCSKVKKMFGESFRHIDYVECDPRGDNEQSLLCIEKEIESYATFEFNDDPSTRLIGEPTFEELAAATGCVAPRVQ